MIDLHAHVLPGIDDGPSDVKGSIDLVLEAAADGTRVLAATPHARHDYPRVRVDRLADQCAELGRRMPPGVDIELVPGAECDLAWAQEASDDALLLASLGQRGTHLLVETPYGELPPTFEELLFRLSVRGYRVLLAHPERNPTLQRDAERVASLVRSGVLLQVTALSLASTTRHSRSRSLARALVERGLAHVIASDAHSADGRARLSAGVAAAARIAPSRAEWMVTDAPAAILRGEPLPPPPGERPAGRPGLFRRLSGA